jgi:nucleotide-binding universal stress UspA family protein
MPIVISRILVPIDFSAASDSALRYGRALAETFSASIHLLHIIEDTIVYGGSDPLPHSIREDWERTARKQLSDVMTDAERERFKAELVIRTGAPFVEIVRYAKDFAADLIVMGAHGHGPIAHMLIGSVADKVVRKAPCPVLTVRDPSHQFVMP